VDWREGYPRGNRINAGSRALGYGLTGQRPGASRMRDRVRPVRELRKKNGATRLRNPKAEKPRKPNLALTKSKRGITAHIGSKNEFFHWEPIRV
jgi:hypothetical protein